MRADSTGAAQPCLTPAAIAAQRVRDRGEPQRHPDRAPRTDAAELRVRAQPVAQRGRPLVADREALGRELVDASQHDAHALVVVLVGDRGMPLGGLGPLRQPCQEAGGRHVRLAQPRAREPAVRDLELRVRGQELRVLALEPRAAGVRSRRAGVSSRGEHDDPRAGGGVLRERARGTGDVADRHDRGDRPGRPGRERLRVERLDRAAAAVAQGARVVLAAAEQRHRRSRADPGGERMARALLGGHACSGIHRVLLPIINAFIAASSSPS